MSPGDIFYTQRNSVVFLESEDYPIFKSEMILINPMIGVYVRSLPLLYNLVFMAGKFFTISNSYIASIV